VDNFPLEELSLIHELCRADHYADVQKALVNLTWAATITKQGRNNTFYLTELMLGYITEFGKTPRDLKSFRDYVVVQPFNETELDYIDKIDNYIGPEPITDIDQLIPGFVKHARHFWLTAVIRTMTTKMADPDLAQEFYKKMMAKDLIAATPDEDRGDTPSQCHRLCDAARYARRPTGRDPRRTGPQVGAST
jgi:hypothetical protein